MIYLFDNFQVDANRHECRRGEELVAIEPQVFDILLHLVRNRDRIVSSEELIDVVWSGRIVSESTLSSRISVMRQVLGDSGGSQKFIRTIPRKGYRFIAEVREAVIDLRSSGSMSPPPSSPGMVKSPKQATTFCRTADGFELAVASVGEGPVVVRAAHWANSIQYDWQTPMTGPLLQRLANKFRLVRYDGRGIGLSERVVPDLSFETMVKDLEAAVESLGLARFALLGISGGAATSIAYAVRHPERVSKLALFGSYALGRNKRDSAQQIDEAKAFVTMVQSGWGDERSAFLRSFFSFWLPSGTPEQINSFMRSQIESHSGEIAVKLRAALDQIDIVELLPKVRTPTLIFHCARDALVPFEQGRKVAASIAGARFVALDSDNHALLTEESAWPIFADQIEEFLGETL